MADKKNSLEDRLKKKLDINEGLKRIREKKWQEK